MSYFIVLVAIIITVRMILIIICVCVCITYNNLLPIHVAHNEFTVQVHFVLCCRYIISANAILHIIIYCGGGRKHVAYPSRIRGICIGKQLVCDNN